MRTISVTLTILGIAALTACGPTPAPPATASAASASVTAAPASPAGSPSPSPTPAAASCLDDQVVPGRLGCLDANLPVVGNPGEGDVIWNADYCAAGDGRYTYAGSDLVSLEGHDGTAIGRIDVYEPTLTTPEGIHVGSTETEVLAAYSGMSLTTSFSGTKLLVVSNPDGSYVIELADGWGADPEWTVANIRIYASGIDANYPVCIYASGIDANYPVYGTEDLAGICPFDF